MPYEHEVVGGKPPTPSPKWWKRGPVIEQEKGFEDYFAELERDGRTVVPCPYGHGTYTVSTHGSYWYQTPEIVFRASKTCPRPFNSPRFAGRCFSVNGGRVIPWYPQWGGGSLRRNVVTERLQFAKMVVRIILAGRKLYLLRCGDKISSLDDDRGLERRYAEASGDYDNEYFHP